MMHEACNWLAVLSLLTVGRVTYVQACDLPQGCQLSVKISKSKVIKTFIHVNTLQGKCHLQVAYAAETSLTISLQMQVIMS